MSKKFKNPFTKEEKEMKEVQEAEVIETEETDTTEEVVVEEKKPKFHISKKLKYALIGAGALGGALLGGKLLFGRGDGDYIDYSDGSEETEDQAYDSDSEVDESAEEKEEN